LIDPLRLGVSKAYAVSQRQVGHFQEALLPICGRTDCVPFKTKKETDPLTNGGIVLHDEHTVW
jgi:hypothetical protein